MPHVFIEVNVVTSIEMIYTVSLHSRNDITARSRIRGLGWTVWVQALSNPDSKVHEANMGHIWGRQDPSGPHVGPMNFVIWVNAISSLQCWRVFIVSCDMIPYYKRTRPYLAFCCVDYSQILIMPNM